jgi:hypothetical protein
LNRENILHSKLENTNGNFLRRLVMKNSDDQISEGLNQIFEIINAKGDTGELYRIVERSNTDLNHDNGDVRSKNNESI